MIKSPHTAFVFPGQGSQNVGMLSDAAQAYPSIKQVFQRASAVLGYDLWAIVSEGPAQQLDQTAITQPALLTASFALWQLVQQHRDFTPAFLAGHSLGEYTALVCAGALTFEDGVKLVAARGTYMQEAVQPGVGLMAAIIGLDNELVARLCAEAIGDHQEVVSPANYNSVGQVVIAGHYAAVERVMTLAKTAGAKLVTSIPVSVPSHCALMTEAANRLQSLLQTIDIKSPLMPVISNVDVKPYLNGEAIRDGLVRQLCHPVRWVETVQYMVQSGISTLIECGPGKVLTGLAKRIDKSLQLVTLSDLHTLNQLLSSNERDVNES